MVLSAPVLGSGRMSTNGSPVRLFCNRGQTQSAASSGCWTRQCQGVAPCQKIASVLKENCQFIRAHRLNFHMHRLKLWCSCADVKNNRLSEKTKNAKEFKEFDTVSRWRWRSRVKEGRGRFIVNTDENGISPWLTVPWKSINILKKQVETKRKQKYNTFRKY